jgi:NADH:ubiquinone oxidoreductase subunit F (NADH-binding)
MSSTLGAAPRLSRRLLAGPGDGRLDGHLARNGRPPTITDGTQLIDMVRGSGLTGRGGAGFPAWRKLAAVTAAVAAGGRPPVVIANGAEGEPASAKDRTLLAAAPHLVLDGLQLAARAVGARTAYLYVPAASATAMRAAVVDRRAAGLDLIEVGVVIAPDAFLSGEESAVVAAVSGRRAVPADKTHRITDVGVGGAPTLVQNVETLAHLALIARLGPEWFRGVGTGAEPGTFLATVGGAVHAPGVLEAGYGVRLADLIAAAGGATAPLQAVLVGGYHGGWAPAHPDLPISREALGPYGAAPGAGVVVALPTGACGLRETSRIAGYLAGQTAGQCGPCINGLPRLADTLADLAELRIRPGLPQQVQRLAALVTGRGACRHPDGTARLIRSALRMFDADVTAHLGGHCRSHHQGVRR